MFGAIDVGGTKTLVAIFDSNGKILRQEKFETPPKYKDFLEELARVVDKLSTKNIKNYTVGLPGRLNRERGIAIRFGNLDWKDIPVRNDIEKIVHAPVVIENDARLGGLYEARLLKDKYKKVLYVTVSTGIGAGFCTNGSIDIAARDMETGSMMFEHDGEMQRWESFASGKAIKERFGKRASDITDPKAWKIISDNLSVGIINMIANLTPEVIVFGGGVGAHFEKFQPYLEQDLKKYATNMLVIPKLLKAKKPEEAVIYGCFVMSKDKDASANS